MTTLKRHPDSRGGLDLRLEAEAERASDGALALRFLLTGAVEEVLLPAAARSERCDELWRSTCFEAFLPAAGGGYYEFNFAPSTAWAAYRFEGYRQGMTLAQSMPPPQIEDHRSSGLYDLRVILEPGGLPDSATDPTNGLHLAAIVETVGRETSYWATRHAPGKPDFHAFALPDPA